MNFTNLKNSSSTQKLVFTAIMAGIAFLLNFIEIPFMVPYLKLDISEAIVIITVMLLGLKYGLMVSIIKALLFYLFGANGSEIIGCSILLLSSCFLATIFYLVNSLFTKLFKNNTIKFIITFLIIAFIYASALSLLNYRITVPLYSGVSFETINKPGYLASIFALYFPFNIIKIALVSVVVILFNKLFLKRNMNE
ncbi:MAG: ECF transporter S component [Bacilli bacterium]|jgi:riboflavin transporter FmnP|nr:ECF transporter S component [Bacilli bacterium]